MQRRLYIDEAHTALDIFRFAVFFAFPIYILTKEGTIYSFDFFLWGGGYPQFGQSNEGPTKKKAKHDSILDLEKKSQNCPKLPLPTKVLIFPPIFKILAIFFLRMFSDGPLKQYKN